MDFDENLGQEANFTFASKKHIALINSFKFASESKALYSLWELMKVLESKISLYLPPEVRG